MIERDLLLNATAAVLLACLAWHWPQVSRRGGRGGLALVVTGTLWPFLDMALWHATVADRIEYLTRPPVFQAPLFGLAAIAALAGLVRFAVSWRPALHVALCLAVGFGAHIALAVLTPLGWPLWAPFSGLRVALPILPTGHVALLAMLTVALAIAELLRRRRSWIAVSAAVLAGAYLCAGAIQYAAVTLWARELAGPDVRVSVYPEGNWLLRWQVVVAGPERFELRRRRAFGSAWPEPSTLPRWNDQALFLKLLGDPVVNRFYYRVFRHPVVRLDVSGSQITLLMQELQDQSPLVPGPTFYLESDLSGRNRFYQLQRFN